MTRGPKVFIVNEPLKRDEASGELVRFLPMETAANFGDVVELTPKGSPGGNPAVWMKLIRDGLEKDWEDGDFLVLVGDQALLAYAASVIGEYIGTEYERTDGRITPTIRFLKWERRLESYSPLILREPADDSAPRIGLNSKT